MALVQPSSVGASFFKPANFRTARALLVEPRVVNYDVENNYNGAVTVRDEVVADIHVFDNQADLDNGEPAEILRNTTVTHKGLTRKLIRIMDTEESGAMIARVGTAAAAKGQAYVWEDVEPEVYGTVAAYYEAQVSADAAEADAAPEF